MIYHYLTYHSLDKNDPIAENHFWEVLGGKSTELPVTPTEPSPLWIVQSHFFNNKAELNKNFTELSNNLLDTTTSLILDCFTEIFVWHGSKSPVPVRELARHCAEGMLSFQGLGRPSWVSVQQINEGNETVFFTSKFNHWAETEEARPGPARTAVPNKSVPFDIKKLFVPAPEIASEPSFTNELDGHAEVRPVPNFNKYDSKDKFF